jgi:hypothetical protein
LAARELAASAKAIVDAGGAVVEILGTYAFAPAPDAPAPVATTKAQLDSWITAGNLTVSTFIDAPGKAGQTINLFRVRERAVVVDLATMKVVWHGDGDQGGGRPNNSIVVGTQQIHTFLGQ